MRKNGPCYEFIQYLNESIVRLMVKQINVWTECMATCIKHRITHETHNNKPNYVLYKI